MKCQECPKMGKCPKFFQKGSNAGISCKETAEDEEWSCAQGYGPGRAGPVECEMCDEDDCPSRCADYVGGDDEEAGTCARGISTDEVGPSDCEDCDVEDCDDRVCDYLGDDDDE